MALSSLVKERMRYALNNDAAATEVTDILNAASATNTTELGYLDGITAGTATASKAMVLDANKAIGTITSLTATNANATTIIGTTVNATSSTITNANSTTAIATTVNATNGTITTLNATTASLTNATLGRMQVTATAVNAAGSAIGNAANLSYGVNLVAGTDNTTGVILPVAVANAVVEVFQTVNGKQLAVYPQVNSTISGLTANVAFNTGVANTAAQAGTTQNVYFKFVASNTTNWYVSK